MEHTRRLHRGRDQTHPSSSSHGPNPRKKARRQGLKKLRQESVAVELKQGPSELQGEDPQVRQISRPASRTPRYGSHGHHETPTNPPEEQAVRAWMKVINKRASKKELKKLRQKAAALELQQKPSELHKEDPETPDVRQITPGSLSPPAAALAMGGPETSAPDTRDIGDFCRSLKPEPARLRHSFLYSDRPRRSKRSTRVEEHAGEVSRKFEALPLDQSPPTPDSTQRVKKHDSEVSNRELEARTIHQSPRSTPSIEDYALEVRALKLAQSPPALDSTHRSKECAYDTTNSETGSEIVEEKPKNESVPWVYKPLRFDILEALIAHSHGYSNPVQHRRDAQALWASGKRIISREASESLVSPTENLAQGEASTKEIIENGKKWMGKEVMLVFEKYIEGKKQFEDVLYCFDEIQHQCFSVDSYDHRFHHFNFTVKTKKISDDHWTLTPYFSEVKELYGRKFHTCYKLHSYDDGHCYACKNQGMHALQHPILGMGYEGGHAAMGPSFIYLNDDDEYFD